MARNICGAAICRWPENNVALQYADGQRDLRRCNTQMAREFLIALESHCVANGQGLFVALQYADGQKRM
jgi:hypothetical protein